MLSGGLQSDGAIDNLFDQIKELQERTSILESYPPSIDIIPWTNYGATSTVVGWSSYTTKTILYKKIANRVFVQFAIQGTSSLATASFTLRDSVDVLGSGQVFQITVYGIDNGSPQTLPARLDIPASGNTFNVYKDLAATAWTASGIKGVRGEFHYEAV